MKKIMMIACLFTAYLVNGQAFTGKGDKKLQIGANLQDHATGMFVSFDYGLGENFSIGASSIYALGVSGDIDADFTDRFDIRARFNANIGSVLNIDENFDLYPGLSFGLKNFGGHVGARYFFSTGFGIFTEAFFPIAKYNSDDLKPAEEINNQFGVNIGAVFNLN
ncbi:DUF6646 family protein [Formosa maritima]|uniref:Porin family protein n=1 Tax=Formosa maritima TaxID=2592046 RepID=A0A5D0FZ29_9FLAO|nr:DUF6646 family protein [Formosa maritima]TYA52133.1 hypothetical protein FVF61_12330 [Formosa maritima]